jgi:Uma2 family endonuclease
LVIEVISAGNTAGEMARKRGEYFSVGVQLVWMVIPATRTAEVYTDIDQSIQLSEADSLDGGSVLPGFWVSIRELFHELDR